MGWLAFLGDGQIEGSISTMMCGDVSFKGYRVSDNEARAPRSSQSMRIEWEGYGVR